jgi:chromosome partitioning protein
MVAEKGGVGKSTISALLSQVISYANKRVLLLDLDQQADSSAFMALPKITAKTTILDFLAGRCSYDSFVKNGGIRKSGNSSVDVITGSVYLIDLYGQLSAEKSIDEIRAVVSQNFPILAKNLAENYDFVFVDFPPGVNAIWKTILDMSSQIIIPVTPHLLAMQSAVKCKIILSNYGIDSEKISIVPNQISASSSHKKDLDLIKESFGEEIYVADNYIPQASAVEKILEYEQNIFIKWFGNKDVRNVINAFCNLAEEIYDIDKNVVINNIEAERKAYLSKYKFS